MLSSHQNNESLSLFRFHRSRWMIFTCRVLSERGEFVLSSMGNPLLHGTTKIEPEQLTGRILQYYLWGNAEYASEVDRPLMIAPSEGGYDEKHDAMDRDCNYCWHLCRFQGVHKCDYNCNHTCLSMCLNHAIWAPDLQISSKRNARWDSGTIMQRLDI